MLSDEALEAQKGIFVCDFSLMFISQNDGARIQFQNF